jgi:hypothetical protein
MRKAVVAAIFAGLLAVGGWVYAQQTAQAPLEPFPAPGNIVTAPDIGLRVEGVEKGRVIGTVMVRLKDGSWVPVQFGRGGVHKLETN